ncbi:MAG: cation:proton antiporter, partial [Verrucomicrobiaceae bacterium]
MGGVDFLQDLAIIMVVAGLAGWACQRIGLSSVVGFLFAGIIMGPYTPPFAFVSDLDRIQTLSQLGLVFLMFSVGMGLSIRRLRRMGIALVLATAIGALIVFASTRPTGYLLGWTSTQTLFLAGMLMVSSSAIIDKVLHEIGATHEPASRLALGITVLEDTVAVVMLTVLTSVSQVTTDGS